MFRARNLVAVAIFVGGALYLFRFVPSTRQAEVGAFESKSKEVITPPPAPIAPTSSKPFVHVSPAASPTTSTTTATVPSDQVHFVVEEGLAITHGDILLGDPDSPGLKEGVATIQSPDYWSTAEIPFAIDSRVEAPERIEMAIAHIQEKTGLRFVPYVHQPDAIIFKKGEVHCVSPLGRQGGLQPIRLNAKCGWNEVAHEILHSLGFIHEQSRADRDKYVDILWGNIDSDFKDQFQILPYDFLGPARDMPFDYQSIMLYGDNVFAKEKGLTTMRSKTERPIAPSKAGLSAGDIARIKAFFGL